MQKRTVLSDAIATAANQHASKHCRYSCYEDESHFHEEECHNAGRPIPILVIVCDSDRWVAPLCNVWSLQSVMSKVSVQAKQTVERFVKEEIFKTLDAYLQHRGEEEP